MAEGYFQESFFIDRWILIKNYQVIPKKTLSPFMNNDDVHERKFFL